MVGAQHGQSYLYTLCIMESVCLWRARRCGCWVVLKFRPLDGSARYLGCAEAVRVVRDWLQPSLACMPCTLV